MFSALVVGVAVWVLAAGLSDRPVVAVLVNLLVAGGLAPAIWLSRGLPVLRWVGGWRGGRDRHRVDVRAADAAAARALIAGTRPGAPARRTPFVAEPARGPRPVESRYTNDSRHAACRDA